MNKNLINNKTLVNDLKYLLKITRITLFFLFVCIVFSSASKSYLKEFAIYSRTTSVYEQKNKLPVKVIERIVQENNLVQQLQKQISGKITDISGNPLPGVNVLIKGTSTGVVTSSDGMFSIAVPNDNTVLVFSFVGFLKYEIPVGNQTEINLTMKEDTQLIDEIVITGYGGTRSRSKLTNSISSIKEETFKVGVYSNPAQALSGTVSGLRVIQSNGNPMTAPQIVLRGGTNLDGSGSPLILVDGMVRSSLQDINPMDIESMEVLKDAGATAIYGARANNGVVLITTKSGKSGRTEIVVNTKIGLNYMNQPYELLNAGDFIYWSRLAAKNTGRVWQDQNGNWKGWISESWLKNVGHYGTGNLYWDPANPDTPLDGRKDPRAIYSTMILRDDTRFLLKEGWKSMIDPVYGDELIYKEFDWDKNLYRNPAVTQDYNLSLSGGNDKGHYYAGLGFYNAEGMPKIGTFYQRISGTFNGDHKITNWLTSSSNLSFTKAKYFTEIPFSGENNYFARVRGLPPTFRGTNTNGELLVGMSAGDGNPLANIDRIWRDNNNHKLSLGQSFTIDIMKDLSLKLNATWLFDKYVNEAFNRDYLGSPNTWNRTRSSSASFNESFRQMYNAIVDYKFSFVNHHFDILAGSEYYDEEYKAISASGSGAPTDDFASLNYTSMEANKRSINSSHSQERILSFLGRLNYDYLDKYLLSATFRRDGYSRLINNRWGFFPGISAGWVFTNEPFMKNLSEGISFAKLRTSFGLNGNVSGIGTYELQGNYLPITYNGKSGFNLSSLPNPNMRWERSRTFETGLDISFLENRINTNFTWYTRTTLDKYANIPLPGSSGITSIRTNNGTLNNKGVELEMGFKILQRSDWNWNVDLNLAYNKSTIIKLPYNGLERNRQGAFQVYSGKGDELIWVGGYQEGQRPGDVYGYKPLGIYSNEEEVSAAAANRIDKTNADRDLGYGYPLYGPDIWNQFTDEQKASGWPISPGDVNWKDVNGDDTIDIYDKVYMGNTIPPFIGGITSSLSWKGFGLYVRLDYALGHVQEDFTLKWFTAQANGTMNNLTLIKDTWTPENPNAKWPRYDLDDSSGKRNYYRSDNGLFITDASYLSFREVSLTYDMNKEWLQKIGSSGIQLSITGQNLGYLSKSMTYTPEVGGRVSTGWPIPRTFIFGASLKF